MTHEIIKTENYLLVVDDSEIKDGDYIYDLKDKVIRYVKKYLKDDWIKKIIAHRPLHNAPILEGVDVLPPTEEDDVEKLALEYSGDLEDTISNVSYDAYIKGYNKAKENLHEILSDFYYYATDGEVCKHETINEFIQSLSQPKIPIGFEWEMEYKFPSGREYVQPNPDYLHKTTTNNLGQTQWVGKYIYD